MYSYIFYSYTHVFIRLLMYIYLEAHATPAPTSHLLYVYICIHIFSICIHVYSYVYLNMYTLVHMQRRHRHRISRQGRKFGAIIIVFSIFNIEQNFGKFYFCMPAMPAATLRKVRFLITSGYSSYTVNSIASSPFRNGTLARLRFLPRRCTSVKISKVGSVRSFCTVDLVTSGLLGNFTLTRL